MVPVELTVPPGIEVEGPVLCEKLLHQIDASEPGGDTQVERLQRVLRQQLCRLAVSVEQRVDQGRAAGAAGLHLYVRACFEQDHKSLQPIAGSGVVKRCPTLPGAGVDRSTGIDQSAHHIRSLKRRRRVQQRIATVAGYPAGVA